LKTGENSSESGKKNACTDYRRAFLRRAKLVEQFPSGRIQQKNQYTCEDTMNQQNFEMLKHKYASVLSTIQEEGVQLAHLHEENGKLIIAAKAPSDEAKNRVWDTIKKVDAAYKDLKADITVDSNTVGNQSSSLPPSPHLSDEQTYTVEAGDTLSKISKQFYGEASLYMNIFEANRDKITDPNKIQPGMRLRIPVTGKQVTQ